MEKEIQQANPQNWLQLYGDMLYQYCLPRVNDTAAAEDIVQDTFLSALKGIGGYKGEASEKNWLFAILKNKIIDYYRKKASQQTVTASSVINDSEDPWFNEAEHWRNNTGGGEWHISNNETERKELHTIINLCKDGLKELPQQVFTLKYMEDLPSEEICKVLNISSSNYWVLLHRARLQMRGCVEKNWL